MLTVLIAEQRHIDAILKDNSLFFEPFFKNRELVFCEWKPEGQTLAESVPRLRDTVGRCRDWRAVIVHACSDEQKRMRNPFDEVDHSALDALERPNAQPKGEWGEWEREWREYYSRLAEVKERIFRSAMAQPLTRLAARLCFQPMDYVLEDVADRRDAVDWAMAELGEEGKKPSEHLEKLEREQYKLELRLKENIRREFINGSSINIARPNEVYCISERITEDGFFDPDPYWNIRSGSEYSGFADRNMLFDKMRFMVFDVLPQTHRSYRSDRLRFLYTLMVFASNDIPASAMQARRLYRLDLENDETPLCVLATSYEKKLTSTLEVIENEIDKIRSEIPGELTDREAATLFLVPADVPVTLDKSCDTEALEADVHYGLASDWPESEAAKWAADDAEAEKAMAYILKQQDRAARKSINRLGYLSGIDGRDVSRLTSFQMDDIREYTESAEDEMITTLPPDLTDTSGCMEPMREKAEKVKTIIGTRMSKKVTFALGGIALALYLICFLPLLFGNFANGKTIAAALIIIGVTLGLVALVMLLSLLFLRRPLVKAVKEFNGESSSALERVKAAMQAFSGYLSSVCNVRRGNAVMSYCETNPDEYTKSIRIRKKHQEDIIKKRAYLVEGYSDYIADKRYYDDTMIQPYEYDFGLKTEYEYPAPFLAGDLRQVDFLTAGNKVAVPSSYVRRITLRMEEIYEG